MNVQSVKPWILATAALVLSVIFNVLFFGHVVGVSVPLFTVLLLGSIVLFDRMSHRQMSWYEVTLSGVIFVLSLFFAFRVSPALLTINALAMLYLGILLFVSLYGAPVKAFRLLDYLAFPFTDAVIGVATSAGILKRLKPSGMARHTRVLRGVGIGLVLVIIFLALFAAADPVFQELLTRVISVEFLKELYPRAVQVALVFLGLLLAFAPAFWKHVDARQARKAPEGRRLGIEAAVTLGAVNLVFVVFLMVRAAYLFGGDARLAEFDLTYAEYARQGFFQLLVVAVIVAVIIWAMRYLKSGRATVLNQVLQSVLLLQTGLVLISSWMALTAYEVAYGFTELRFFSHIGLLVIGALLVLLFVGVVARVKDAHLLQGGLAVVVIAILGMNLVNPDLFIANKNVVRWELGEELDYALLLTELSDDAAPAIFAHAQTLNEEDLQTLTNAHPHHFNVYDSFSIVEGEMLGSREVSVEEALRLWDANLHNDRRVERDYGYREIEYRRNRTATVRVEPLDTAWQSWNAARAWKENNVLYPPRVNEWYD